MNGGLMYLWNRYGLSIYITENGLFCNDKIYLNNKVYAHDHTDFLTRYLRELSKCMKKADVCGCFHWLPTDNFEWHSGYTERFELV